MESSKMGSLSVQYDDLMRYIDHHTNYSVDSEFLEFVKHYQDVVVKKWQEAESECTRLQAELVNAHSELARCDTKISSIRRHLETKIELQGKLDAEIEQSNLKIDSAKALIRSYLSDPRASHETKERIVNVLALLEGSVITDVDPRIVRIGTSPGGVADFASEANSTDLSMTQSEDDLDVSCRKAHVQRLRQSNKRPSLDAKQGKFKKHCNTGTKQSVEVSTSDRIIVKTVVSSKKSGGPLHAIASVETEPRKGYMDTKPSAPPVPPSDSESEPQYHPPPPRKTPPAYSSSMKPSTSYASPATMGVRIGQPAQRPHVWCQKTVIKPETCEPCGKRIKFSKLAFKCRDCKATCHPECKDKVPLPCVMTGTPSGNKHQMGTVADYAPTSHPMVPALIQHCVNAIESRGKDIVGLYRVPGPEKEVKDLKERFLKGKGVPNLLRYDIHAVCGCIKDFLKSLQEPLVGRWFWKDFAIAADISDPVKRMVELERIVKELPPANQDTLAYLILHLQRIAEYPEVKMPISNLSKVFGPTVVGYSGPDIDGPTMLKETKKQQQVMESFLNAPKTFWESFVYRQEENTKLYAQQKSTDHLRSTPSKSPSILKLRESNKKIYFDDSPNNRHQEKNTQRRNFFD